MDTPRYEITIKTVGVPLEEIPRILEQIKNSFMEGYVVGAGCNDADKKSYDFETTEL